MAIAPNDGLAASASQDRTVKLWKLPSLAPVATLRGHKRGVWSVEFSAVDQVCRAGVAVRGRGPLWRVVAVCVRVCVQGGGAIAVQCARSAAVAIVWCTCPPPPCAPGWHLGDDKPPEHHDGLLSGR